MTNTELSKLFDFDESDLQANRNSHLTDRQKKRLENAEKRSRGCSWILGIFLLGIGLIGVGIVVAAALAVYSEDRGAAIWLIAGFGVVWPLIWGWLGVASVRRSLAKVEIKVKKAEGPINIVKVVRDSYNATTNMHDEEEIYELHIGRKNFEVDSRLPDLMSQGDVYAVYYAGTNLEDAEDEILSAEFLKQR